MSLLLQLISAIDRHRQSTDHPIKFISRRQPNILKFKMKPGMDFLFRIVDKLHLLVVKLGLFSYAAYS